VYEKPAGGQGEEKVLLESVDLTIPTDWSRDGRHIAFMRRNPKTDFDVWVMPMAGDRKPIPVIATAFSDITPKFSPDSRFIVYVSNESGRNEVYVQTFPAPTGKWQVSNAGGTDPVWRADGREILYRAGDQRLMAVEVQMRDGFQAGVPRPLFLTSTQPGTARNKYAASGDAQRFLFVAPLGRDALTPTTVVLNWHAELER
jgi:dipeptidyl aminopeptidase/acylaminoacyl peptidase